MASSQEHIVTSGIGWRDTFRPARFFMIDARVLFIILPTILHFRWYTIMATVLVAGVLYFFEKRQEMQVPGALRMLRWWFIGHDRPARPRLKRRWMIDYAHIDR